jgi:asparagine synthase (glutamine-hydrolysing)
LVNTESDITIPAKGKSTQEYFNFLPDISSQSNGYNLILGFRRLSILDLSHSGHQPMTFCSNRYWIVFNGEIYNYLELRKDLERLGYKFQSTSDTEVILASYQEWGISCLSYFNGMWSFAIWDSQKKELFLARDRFGVKPFYYCINDHLLAFASEIKPLLRYIHSRPNLPVVNNYLADGSLNNVSDQTFFSNIYCLPPGNYALLDSSSRSVKPHQYWFWPLQDDRLHVTQGEAAEQVRDLLKDAVSLRLRSDVPIGSSLSGGLDSSSIVCLIQQILIQGNNTKHYQHTVSSVFPGLSINEEKWIDELATSLHVQSHKTQPQPQEMQNVLNKMIWHMDEPLGGSSSYAQLCVFQKANEVGLKVMLDGQGSDEIFAGYEYIFLRYVTGLVEQGKYQQAIIESLLWKKRVGSSLNIY